MKIQLVGEGTPLAELKESVTKVITDMNLSYDIEVATTNDPSYKLELGITENPALCIEEETIDFRDVIFQGEIPTEEEIRSIFISILGDEEESGCGDGCGTCESGCHTVGK